MNIKNYILILLLLLAGKFSSFAQQDPIYNQYMFNPLVVNPAYAGSRDQMSVIILNRSQWVGFDGAPNTQTASFHAPVLQGKVGLGAIITRDAVGPTTRTGISGSYAYRLKLRTGKIAFALRTGIYNYNYNWQKIEYKNGEEPLVNQNKSSGWVPNFDFGIRYSTRNLYAGLTFLNLNNPQLKFLDTDTSSFASALSRHVNFTAGYAWEINKDFVLKPSTMIRYEKYPTGGITGSVLIADANVSVLYKNMIWLGISYRSSKSILAIIEYNINKQLRIGYSYELTVSKLRTTNSGTHEVFIGVDFGRKHKPKLMSPRVYF